MRNVTARSYVEWVIRDHEFAAPQNRIVSKTARVMYDLGISPATIVDVLDELYHFMQEEGV